jgi:hypothetical protein
MIDWGGTPEGSIASIYWPQLQANDVIQVASYRYGYHALSAYDANTLQCSTFKGVTYIPIAHDGRGNTNIAGLFTVDLPTTVVSGQEFNIVIRRVRARLLQAPIGGIQVDKTKNRRQAAAAAEVPSSGKSNRNSNNSTSSRSYRVVIGSFNIRIPVSTPDQLLQDEADTLTIMKARLDATDPADRWFPVLKRYVGYLSGRVDGLGGAGLGSAIPGSFGGAPVPRPLPGPFPGGKECCYTWKVTGVCYDGSGCMRGF